MTETLKRILIIASVVWVSGCSSLPNMQRIQGNMDQMVYYMGVMAQNMPHMTYNTSRMADAAERMERKSNGMIKDFQKKGPEVERTIQNYGQSFLDNDRAVIKSLKGINAEIKELNQSIRSGGDPKGSSADQERINARTQARLNELEAKLQAISKQLSGSGPKN